MSNSWPNGIRRTIRQDEHESWNANHYPGTRQLCCKCDEPTERCEEDAIYSCEIGPLCPDCNDD